MRTDRFRRVRLEEPRGARIRSQADPHRTIWRQRMMALDGNALAGALCAHFGREMTATEGTCTHCGARSVIAELAVYTGGPGTVARCRQCGGVVMVLVHRAETTRAYLDGFDLADKGASG